MAFLSAELLRASDIFGSSTLPWRFHLQHAAPTEGSFRDLLVL